MILDLKLRDKIAADLLDRKEKGIQEYGTPLSVASDNLALQDAYEEALDCLLYILQAIEQKNLQRQNKPIVDLAIEDTLENHELRDVYKIMLEVVCRLAMFKIAEKEEDE